MVTIECRNLVQDFARIGDCRRYRQVATFGSPQVSLRLDLFDQLLGEEPGFLRDFRGLLRGEIRQHLQQTTQCTRGVQDVVEEPSHMPAMLLQGWPKSPASLSFTRTI